MKALFLSGMAAVVILSGCGPTANKLDVSSYGAGDPGDRRTVEIPAVCKGMYESAIPSVAVVPFTNNSTFGKAELDRTEREKHLSAGIGAGGGIGFVGAGIKADEQSRSYQEKRSSESRLGESVAESIEGKLGDMGGVRIFSRLELEKIMQEQRLQQSGLLNEETLVELGELAGVRYIVTGSVNNVSQKFTGKVDGNTGRVSRDEDVAKLQMALKLGSILYNVSAAGMVIGTEVTVKVVDVQTGEVVMSKNVAGTKDIGQVEHPTFDQVIGGVKEASREALESIHTELSKYFKLRGYVINIKSGKDKRIALISLGEKQKVKEGQDFWVYSFESVQDPMTQKSSCDMYRLPVTLKASDQIQKDRSWATVEGKSELLMRGMLIERVPLK